MDQTISNQIDAIHAAFADGATVEQRRAGAIACRTLLAVLEGQPGRSLDARATPSSLAQALGQLGRLDIDDVLDLAILKLRSMVPDASPSAPSSAFKLPVLKLPGGAGP